MNKTKDKQNIHFFTGKGGVGKSVVAASKAMSLAASGERVLLLELDGSESLKEMLSGKSLNFDCLCLKPLEELKGLFTYFFKVKKVSELFFGNKAMKSLVEAAPGLKELAGLGKITSYNRKFGPGYDYDHIVVDAYSTGHFISWLNVPVGMSDVIKRGPMGEQCKGIVESLKEAEFVHYYAVVNPEKAPKNEGLHLSQEINKLVGVNSSIILNKLVKENKSVDITSEYVLQQINESRLAKKEFKKFNTIELPLSFKESSYEQALELSALWK